MNAIDEAGVDFSEDANQRLEHCKIKKDERLGRWMSKIAVLLGYTIEAVYRFDIFNKYTCRTRYNLVFPSENLCCI